MRTSQGRRTGVGGRRAGSQRDRSPSPGHRAGNPAHPNAAQSLDRAEGGMAAGPAARADQRCRQGDPGDGGLAERPARGGGAGGDRRAPVPRCRGYRPRVGRDPGRAAGYRSLDARGDAGGDRRVTIREKQLLAWLDGELDEAGAEEVEQAVQADPALMARAEAHFLAMMQLRAAFAPLLEAPFPPPSSAAEKADPEVVEQDAPDDDVADSTAQAPSDPPPSRQRWGHIAALFQPGIRRW